MKDMAKDTYRTDRELDYAQRLERHFNGVSATFSQKMQAFPRFVPRQQQAIYLFKYELFKRILDVQGSILEFGVFMGSGLFSFASFSAILEPYNYQRKIVGFDTFTGFPDVSQSDVSTARHSPLLEEGGFRVGESLYEELAESVEVFDQNRFINHIGKVDLVRGDIRTTLPEYLDRNPHTLVSLLYLDMDVYEPTLFALRHLYDRVPRGGIVAFDEVNNERWPGETKALMEFFGAGIPKLQKLPFEPLRSFFVKE